MAPTRKIKIDAEGFRVPPVDGAAVGERTTHVKPFCKSIQQNKNVLEQPVEALTELQRLHYAAGAMRCC